MFFSALITGALTDVNILIRTDIAICDTVNQVQLSSCYTSFLDVGTCLLLRCLAGIKNNRSDGYCTSNSSVDGHRKVKLPVQP